MGAIRISDKGGEGVDIELRWLTIFDEIYKTGSVTQAAENLELSQPSVSLGLAKLRKYFNDPLFVRTSRGMEPTPHAAELIGPIRQALTLLHTAVRHRVVFDAARSERTFRIAMTDISQVILLPQLMNHLKQVAPALRIEVMHIGAGIAAELEAGAADLAIGFIPQLEAGFYQQQLFRQQLLCVVRRDHPRIGDTLTLERFVAEAHIVVSLSGTGHWIVDKVLEDRQIHRRIVLRVPSFLGIGRLVASTDLIVIVPGRFAQLLEQSEAVKALTPPIELPAFAVKQHWHERYHHDEGNRWLRATVSELFADHTGALPRQ